MTDLVKQCDSFYGSLTTRKKKVNVIPIAITFSFMHLAILKERNTYHKNLWKRDFPDGDYDKLDHDQLLQLCDDKPGVITDIISMQAFSDLNRDSNYVTEVDVYFQERIVSGIQFIFSNEPSSKGDKNNVIGNGDKNPDIKYK
ncbi:5123_t:CDS:2, partial [Scutellospora calospora]